MSHDPPGIIGVLHLPPLPGAPKYENNLRDIIEAAREDTMRLAGGGVDAVLVENYGDAPFQKTTGPETVASMTRIISDVQDHVDLPLGVNVLRNDPISALSIAHATRASFIRVNVLVGAVATDQGVIEGMPRRVIRLRRELGDDTSILADVFVKHGQALWTSDIGEAARDTVERGLADAVIVTGPRTGAPPTTRSLNRVRRAVDAPVYVGSGCTPKNIKELLQYADGAIVGTCLKQDGRVNQDLVEEFVRAARG